jgi:hypothetical protein
MDTTASNSKVANAPIGGTNGRVKSIGDLAREHQQQIEESVRQMTEENNGLRQPSK